MFLLFSVKMNDLGRKLFGEPTECSDELCEGFVAGGKGCLGYCTASVVRENPIRDILGFCNIVTPFP